MTNKLLSFLTKPFTDFIKKKKNQSNLKKKLKSIPNYSSFKEIKELEGNLNNFENELLKAVETEQYERAAELRDKIRKIKEERKGLRQ